MNQIKQMVHFWRLLMRKREYGWLWDIIMKLLLLSIVIAISIEWVITVLYGLLALLTINSIIKAMVTPPIIFVSIIHQAYPLHIALIIDFQSVIRFMLVGHQTVDLIALLELKLDFCLLFILSHHTVGIWHGQRPTSVLIHSGWNLISCGII